MEALEATVRDLNQRLCGTKSERVASSDAAGQPKPGSARDRGQQPGTPGHGRRDRSALPVVAEIHDLNETAKHCHQCGEVLAPFPGAKESAIIEVQVQAHVRRIQRWRYQPTCGCG